MCSRELLLFLCCTVPWVVRYNGNGGYLCWGRPPCHCPTTTSIESPVDLAHNNVFSQGNIYLTCCSFVQTCWRAWIMFMYFVRALTSLFELKSFSVRKGSPLPSGVRYSQDLLRRAFLGTRKNFSYFWDPSNVSQALKITLHHINMSEKAFHFEWLGLNKCGLLQTVENYSRPAYVTGYPWTTIIVYALTRLLFCET